MRRKLIAAVVILLFLGKVAYAHRLDEYLQATMLSVEKDHVLMSMRLIPGVAVSSSVIASMDSNGDGILSDAEQRAYAQRVLGDLSLTVDGKPLKPQLVSMDFPRVDQMKDGLGEIHLELQADLPPGNSNRRLVLENHHEARNSAYLVNVLASSDPDIHILIQNRNEQQSFYELNYTQTGTPTSPSFVWMTNLREHLNNIGFASLFRLGIRHIAEGTDHLLFLLALLLPAPLIVIGGRWASVAGVHSSLLKILKIVTAFTIGHSITLALAALGFVHVPSHPIEVLIAVSILVSAIHALKPIFPGKEAGMAAFFGLIHGLAFAATLDQLGLGRWQRLGGILAFNLGIETMQLIVVAVTLPSLLLMSRTRAYPFLRIGGALFAGFASVGWILERLLGVHNSVDVIVDSAAHHAIWIACSLFLISLGSWLMRDTLDRQANEADWSKAV